MSDFDREIAELLGLNPSVVGPVDDRQKRLIRVWEVEQILHDLLEDKEEGLIRRDYLREALYGYSHAIRRRWETRRFHAVYDYRDPLDLRTEEQKQDDALRIKIWKLRQTAGRTAAEIRTGERLARRLEGRLNRPD